MIRACIVDDEAIACRKLQRMLKEDQEIEIVGICHNGADAVEALENLAPELIFLDIQMPEMDGFQVLKNAKSDQLPQVIFVTAYDSYAIQAFEVHALDYLLKPYDRKRLQRAVERAKRQIQQQQRSNSNTNQLRTLLAELASPQRFRERLIVKDRGVVTFVKAEEIDWIEAQGKYEVVHAGNQTHLIREGMAKLEAELNPRKFVRIHKSTIVNLDRIEKLEPLFHADFRVFLKNGTSLTISRRYRQKMEAALGKRL
jgi:two-component system, LytTR family, response regulator